MLRLSATGSDAQIDNCLTVLRDKTQTGKLAAHVEWRETPAYQDFLALPKCTLYAWNDDEHVYVAGQQATKALELFLLQILHFEHDEGSIWKRTYDDEEAFTTIMAKLHKLTDKWGFDLDVGTKPDWAHGSN